jgi:hypothetical protein
LTGSCTPPLSGWDSPVAQDLGKMGTLAGRAEDGAALAPERGRAV